MVKEKGIKYSCDLCGELIEIGRPRYILKGEIFAAYDGGKFDETPSIPPENFAEEIKRIMAIAEQKSEKELTDEVHYPFEHDLCRTCRDRIYTILLSME